MNFFFFNSISKSESQSSITKLYLSSVSKSSINFTLFSSDKSRNYLYQWHNLIKNHFQIDKWHFLDFQMKNFGYIYINFLLKKMHILFHRDHQKNIKFVRFYYFSFLSFDFDLDSVFFVVFVFGLVSDFFAVLGFLASFLAISFLLVDLFGFLFGLYQVKLHY